MHGPGTAGRAAAAAVVTANGDAVGLVCLGGTEPRGYDQTAGSVLQ